MRCTALRVKCHCARYATDDQRRRAFGRPLDFVFYRGLNVSEASVLVTRASATTRYSLNSVPANLNNNGVSGLP